MPRQDAYVGSTTAAGVFAILRNVVRRCRRFIANVSLYMVPVAPAHRVIARAMMRAVGTKR